MYRHFDARVAERLREIKADAVYAYEGGALHTFREAKRQGIATFYELTTGHWFWKRKVLTEEAERNPRFAGLLPQLNDSAEHWEEKGEELLLADRIFVPSQHVRRTLEGVVPDEKIHVICYGAPPVQREKPVSPGPKRPLKVLFVGVLAQSKGIGYLLDAIDQLGAQVELTLVGKRIAAHPLVDEACQRWRWIETIPHGKVLDLMAESDVLVLPSFSEGFGLVVTEALACGLPVIVTPNVGASDLVCDGREGFVVPAGSAEAIAGRLNLLDQDRGLLTQMSRHAQTTAAEQSWENYRQTLAETVKAASWR
jgi:glycosyltransferase involved in cell wall biosynthesis